MFNQFIVGEILLRAFFWDAQYSEWTLFCNIICIRFYFKFCCLDYASFFESFSFFHLWSYIQIQEALFFVDFYGDCLGHTNMNRQLFCFLFLAFFLLFIFFVIPIIVRTVRPGGGQNWDFFLIFFCVAPSTATAGTLSKLSAQNNKSLNKKGYRSCSCYA